MKYAIKWSITSASGLRKPKSPADKSRSGSGTGRPRYCSWVKNYGQVYEHNGWIPRDHWLDEWEKQAILQYHFDSSYLNIAGTFYFMATILDGFSRSIVDWDIREKWRRSISKSLSRQVAKSTLA